MEKNAFFRQKGLKNARKQAGKKRIYAKYILTLSVFYYIINWYDYSQKDFCYFINTWPYI